VESAHPDNIIVRVRFKTAVRDSARRIDWVDLGRSDPHTRIGFFFPSRLNWNRTTVPGVVHDCAGDFSERKCDDIHHY
jgi:hypothetical protein